MTPVYIDNLEPNVNLAVVTIVLWLLIGFSISWIRRDPFHPAAIFSLFYAIEIPSKILLSLYGVARMNSVDVVGTDAVRQALYLATFTGLLFVLPASIIGSPNNAKENALRIPTCGDLPPAAWFVLFTIFMAAFLGPSKIRFLLSGDLVGLRAVALAGEARIGSGSRELLNETAMICLSLAAISVAKHNLYKSIITHIVWEIIFLLVGLILLFATFSKNYMLVPPLAYLISANLFRMKIGKILPPYTFVFLVLASIVLVGAAGLLRGLGAYKLSDLQTAFWLAFMNMQFAFIGGDLYAIVLSRLQDFWFGDLHFKPLVELFTGLIPRFAWTTKPIVMGNFEIMRHFLPEMYYGGTGEVLLFTLPGFFLAAGGMSSLIVGTPLLGVLYGLVYRSAYRRYSKLGLLMNIYLAANAFNVVRSGPSILSPMLVYFVLSLVVICSAYLVDLILSQANRLN